MATKTFKEWFLGRLQKNNATIKFENRKGEHFEIEVGFPKNGLDQNFENDDVRLIDVQKNKEFTLKWDDLITYRFQ